MVEKLLLAAMATLAFNLFASASPSQNLAQQSKQTPQFQPYQSAGRLLAPPSAQRPFRRPSFLAPRG